MANKKQNTFTLRIDDTFSLLAEFSHGAAKMSGGWETSAGSRRVSLSRMRWRFRNNQLRFPHLRHNPQNRFARETSVETRVCFREFFTIWNDAENSTISQIWGNFMTILTRYSRSETRQQLSQSSDLQDLEEFACFQLKFPGLRKQFQCLLSVTTGSLPF